MVNSAGDGPGLPRRGNRSAKSVSVKIGPRLSRIRIARAPLGNAARATRTVCCGIGPTPPDRNDTLGLRISAPSVITVIMT